MPAPVPTWVGPIVTFPDGCSDPPLIHIEFTAPTFDRAPGHIPVSWIVLNETLGPAFGACIPVPPLDPSLYTLQQPIDAINPGILPDSASDFRWFGGGANTYRLYVDGVFIVDIGPIADGATVSFDLATYRFGFHQPDWSLPHTFSFRTTWEDIPGWQTWVVPPLEVTCPPIKEVTGLSPVYEWAILRRNLWPAGFDPGGGIDWGPFGTDVPLFALLTFVEFYSSPEQIFTPAVVYDFESPITTATCTFAGFYDPAAGTTVTDNAPPGLGGDPTATPGVTLTTAWSCRDDQSFLFTGARAGSATPPYNTDPLAAEPAYLQYVTGGNQDIWYYQSALLYLPTNLAAHNPNGDAWMVMGVRNDLANTWNDNVVGLMLEQSNLGVFTIRSFFGSPNFAVVDPLFFGTPVTIRGSGPHCLQMSLRRNSVGSPGLEWTFQVDDAPAQSLSTNPIYTRPAYALWGILDNITHDDSGDPLCRTCTASVFYMDDLHFDTVAYGCRCRPNPNAVFATPHPFRAEG